jgi:RNA polymerase subunit RPABC4/transcription elongation factor Spt4
MTSGHFLYTYAFACSTGEKEVARFKSLGVSIVCLLIVGLFLASSLAVGQTGNGTGVAIQQSHLKATPRVFNPIFLCGKNANLTYSPTGPIAGNITVCNGAALTLKARPSYPAISIDSFTATNNYYYADDLNYRFHINVTNGGQLHIDNSMVNTTASALGAYAKLNLSVSDGVITVNAGALAFAGTVYVANHSTLFLNNSVLEPNPSLPVGPQNMTEDNSYAPTLTVVDGSNVVSMNSSIIGAYKDSQAPGAQVDQNFWNSTNATVANNTIYGVGPRNVGNLFYDNYDVWSGARLTVDTASTTGFDANVGLSAYNNNTDLVSRYFAPGLRTTTIAIPMQYVQNTLQAGGLRGLLMGLQTQEVGVQFTKSTANTGTSWITGAQLTLIPQFGFNETFASGSHLYAVDSTFNVNWVNSTCFAPSYSNKLNLTGGSTADLLNTTANTVYSGPGGVCSDVNAFQVDGSSQYLVYNWIKVRAVSSTGTELENASISALANGTDTATNGLFTRWSNQAYFASPLFRSAVEIRANPTNLPNTYGNTSASGNVSYALATSVVTKSSLPQGSFVGAYQLSFSEENYLIGAVGGGHTVLQATTSTSNLCPWPYYAAGCAVTTLSSPIVLPLITADLRVAGQPTVVSVNGQSCGGSTCAIYEGDSIVVNVPIYDANNYIIAKNASVPVWLFNNYYTDTGGLVNQTLPTQDVTNLMFSSFTHINASFSFTVPYGVSDIPSPYFWAAIDLLHQAPSGGSMERNATSQYYVLPSPRVLSSDVVISAIDGCGTNVLIIELSNSCDKVKFQVSVTNSGDAAVNVGVTFTWNSTTQLGNTLFANLNPVVAPMKLFNTTMNVTPNSNAGILSVQVKSISPLGPPPISVDVTSQYYQFADYANPTLTNFSLYQANPTSGGSPIWTKACTTTCASPSAFQIGTLLGIQATFNNTGGPTIANASVAAWYLPGTLDTGCQSTSVAAGSPFVCFMWWHLSDAPFKTNGVVGLQKLEFTLAWANQWAYGIRQFSTQVDFNITLTPPTITYNPSFPATSYGIGDSDLATVNIQVNGVIGFEGSFAASATVNLISANAGIACTAIVTNSSQYNGSTLNAFNLPTLCIVPGTYNIQIVLNYEGASKTVNVLNAITINGPPPSNSGILSNFLFYIIIAIVVAVVAVAVFFFMRRFGKGNLVECGECGELIPESAISCPKCNAEFEREMVRCSRCGSTIGATNKVCPECSILLVGKEQDPNAPAYGRFTDRFRAVAKKELGDNYNEGAFWDWWKRQSSYVPFNTFKQQNAGGAMVGGQSPMMASQGAMGMDAMQQQQLQPPPPAPVDTGQQPMQQQPDIGGAPSGGMKVCPSCGRNINESFLVCPFCGAVTR